MITKTRNLANFIKFVLAVKAPKRTNFGSRIIGVYVVTNQDHMSDVIANQSASFTKAKSRLAVIGYRDVVGKISPKFHFHSPPVKEKL